MSNMAFAKQDSVSHQNRSDEKLGLTESCLAKAMSLITLDIIIIEVQIDMRVHNVLCILYRKKYTC